MTEGTVLLDLRDERGRFFTKVRLPERTYRTLMLLAALKGLTLEDVLHQALEEHAAKSAEEP